MALASPADVQPYLIPSIVPEVIESTTNLQRSDTPVQYVDDSVESTIEQLTPESNRAIIDFDDTEAGQYADNLIDVPQTVSLPEPMVPIDTNDELNKEPHNEAPLQSAAPIIQSIEPKIPISHLIASNQYPSLHHAPPPGIVQSFAPVYVNSANQQQTNVTEELYSSYVNNPYNLTLRVEQNFSPGQIDNELITTSAAAAASIATATLISPLTEPASGVNEHMMAATNMNIFQSAAYFGAQSDASIPPGSEMLFGHP